MSRAKIVGAATVVLLGLVGVMVAVGEPPREPPTELYVRTFPTGARIFVDGREVGTSPAFCEIEPGEHTVTALLEGYETATAKHSVAEGRIRRVILELKRLSTGTAETPKESGTESESLWLSARRVLSTGYGQHVGILAVAFSPDGKTLASIDETGAVILRNDHNWATRSNQFQLVSPTEITAIRSVFPRYGILNEIHSGGIAFSPDGKTLAVGGGPVVKLYDAATGRLKLALDDPTGDDPSQVCPGIAGEEAEALRETLAGLDLAHGTVRCVAFSPDGSMLATSGGHFFAASGATRGCLKLWDAETGELKYDLGEHHRDVRCVTFSPDGKTLTCTGTHPPGWISSVRLWDVVTGKPKAAFSRPDVDPWSVAYSPDGRLLASGVIVPGGGDDPPGMLLVWDLQTGSLLMRRSLPKPVESVAFLADGKVLVSGECDKGVTLWNPWTLRPLDRIDPIDPPADLRGSVRMAFSPKGNMLAVAAEHRERGGFLTLWDITLAAEPPEAVGVGAPVKVTNEAERGTWGQAVGGVQIRLWTEKKTWRVDEEVILKVDCRNQGKRDLTIDERPERFDVCVDSLGSSPDPHTVYVRPVRIGGGLFSDRPGGLRYPGLHLAPGEWKPCRSALPLGRYPGLDLAPGKHTIRVVLTAAFQNTASSLGENGSVQADRFRWDSTDQQWVLKEGNQPSVVVSSNPIEIEIVAAEPTGEPVALPPPESTPRKLFSNNRRSGDTSILAVAFSPDGSRVAAVDEQSNVILWNPRLGNLWNRHVLTPEEKKLLWYEERQGRIHTAAIAFSPDGYTLAVAADPVVRLYDAHSGRIELVLQDKRLVDQLTELDRPPATVLRERELLDAVPHAHGRVYSVAFSPDGKLLSTSGSHLIRADGSTVTDPDVATGGKLKLWDVEAGELKQDLGEHLSPVRSAVFSPDGTTLASIGSHPPGWTSSVLFWDPQTGECQRDHSFHQGGLYEGRVSYSPDGRLIAVGAFFREADPNDPRDLAGISGRGLMILNARTGEPLVARRPPGLMNSLSLSVDSKTLAIGVDGQGVMLFDAETLEPTGQIDLSAELPQNVNAPVLVAFSPVENLLAVGAQDRKRAGSVTVWEIGEPAEIATASAH